MKQFEKYKIPEILPIIPLRTNIVFPHALAPLSINEEHLAGLIKEINKKKELIILTALKSPDTIIPRSRDYYK